MSLFQSDLRRQIRKLRKILKFVKIIHYYSKLFKIIQNYSVVSLGGLLGADLRRQRLRLPLGAPRRGLPAPRARGGVALAGRLPAQPASDVRGPSPELAPRLHEGEARLKGWRARSGRHVLRDAFLFSVQYFRRIPRSMNSLS